MKTSKWKHYWILQTKSKNNLSLRSLQSLKERGGQGEIVKDFEMDHSISHSSESSVDSM